MIPLKGFLIKGDGNLWVNKLNKSLKDSAQSWRLQPIRLQWVHWMYTCLIGEQRNRLNGIQLVNWNELVESNHREYGIASRRTGLVTLGRRRHGLGSLGYLSEWYTVESLAGSVHHRQLLDAAHVQVSELAGVVREAARRRHADRPQTGPHTKGNAFEFGGRREDTTQIGGTFGIRSQAFADGGQYRCVSMDRSLGENSIGMWRASVVCYWNRYKQQ